RLFRLRPRSGTPGAKGEDARHLLGDGDDDGVETDGDPRRSLTRGHPGTPADARTGAAVARSRSNTEAKWSAQTAATSASGGRAPVSRSMEVMPMPRRPHGMMPAKCARSVVTLSAKPW